MKYILEYECEMKMGSEINFTSFVPGTLHTETFAVAKRHGRWQGTAWRQCRDPQQEKENFLILYLNRRQEHIIYKTEHGARPFRLLDRPCWP